MDRTIDPLAKSPWLRVDVEPELRHDPLEDRTLLTALTAEADPVLADLWDNEQDADYDRL